MLKGNRGDLTAFSPWQEDLNFINLICKLKRRPSRSGHCREALKRYVEQLKKDPEIIKLLEKEGLR